MIARAGVLIACLLSVLGAAPAGAPTSVRTGALLAGPALAGERVAYADVTSTSGNETEWTTRYAVRVGTATAYTDRIEFSDFETTTSGARLQLAASATRVALARESYANSQYGGASGLTVRGGPVAGPLDAFAGCSASVLLGDPPQARSYYATGNVALDGDRLAHVDCDESLVVRDLAAGNAVLARIAVRARRPVALAGPYVALVTPSADLRTSAVGVYDWRDGRRLYSVAGDAAGVDVAENGVAVVLRLAPTSHPTTTCLHGTAEWWSADGVGHPLPVQPCTGDVALVGGRAAIVTGDGAQRRLELVGVDGTRQRVADLGLAGMQAGGVDFDGAALAYALRTCTGGATITRLALGEAAPAPGSAACPVRIARTVTLRGDRATVRFTCPAGCTGHVSLRRGTRPLGNAPIPAGTSGSATVRLRLGAAARRLARRGRLRVVVEHANRVGGTRTTAAAVTLR